MAGAIANAKHWRGSSDIKSGYPSALTLPELLRNRWAPTFLVARDDWRVLEHEQPSPPAPAAGADVRRRSYVRSYGSHALAA